MKKIALLLCGFLLFSCAKKEAAKTTIIQGDLYFKITAFHNFYGKGKDEINEFESYMDEVNHKENPTREEKQLASYYNKLKKLDLLDAPFIDIKKNDNKIIQVFLSPEEYAKIRRYNLNQLIARKKKLVVALEVSEPENDIFYSGKIISVKEADGKIPWDK
jgi:hypothetical protein